MRDTLTDRERELVEAANTFLQTATAVNDESDTWKEAEADLKKALRAYDPPKRPECKMPTWDQLTPDQQEHMNRLANENFGMKFHSGEFVLNCVAEALSTEEDA